MNYETNQNNTDAKPRNSRFLRKYKEIQDAFRKKYHVEGKRRNIVIIELEEEFFLGEDRINQILAMTL